MGNASDLIGRGIGEAVAAVNAPPAITPINRNKEIVTLLANRGIFYLKNAIQRTADRLGISKNAVHLHLRNLGAEN